MPSSVSAYLAANYAGNTFYKAFSIKNSSSAITNYVVVIYYNGKPVALEFDASGNFVKVLEQRERGDLEGDGWHHGGRFDDRDGSQKDTIALNALPLLVQSYMAANYATDTLLKAFKNRDSSYIILSKNNGLFATIFDAGGNFVRRVTLPSNTGNCQGIDQSSLPANILSYLTTTYPNYVFKKAFSRSSNGTVKGYVVFIDANNTKYAIEFDTSGNFVEAEIVY